MLQCATGARAELDQPATEFEKIAELGERARAKGHVGWRLQNKLAQEGGDVTDLGGIIGIVRGVARRELRDLILRAPFAGEQIAAVVCWEKILCAALDDLEPMAMEL